MPIGQAAADAASNAARVALPATVGATTFMGFEWQTWVYITTVAFTLIQLGYTLWKWRRDYRRDKIRRRLHEQSRNGGRGRVPARAGNKAAHKASGEDAGADG